MYASSDLHVSASEFETLGNTVLEAFACGVPVVVPRTQGFRDTVLDGRNGFLFEPGSSESARRFIQRLKDDPEERAAMGEVGREAMAHRTVSAVVTDMLRWYAHGTAKRQRKSLFRSVTSVLVLAPMIALTVFMFFWYDILVNYLLRKFISYSESSHSSHCSNQAVKSAAAAATDKAGKRV